MKVNCLCTNSKSKMHSHCRNTNKGQEFGVSTGLRDAEDAVWESHGWGPGTPQVSTLYLKKKNQLRSKFYQQGVIILISESYFAYQKYTSVLTVLVCIFSPPYDLILDVMFLLICSSLCRQNMDITRKYENTMKEVDYYRKQERAAYTALQNLRMQYEEVSRCGFIVSAILTTNICQRFYWQSILIVLWFLFEGCCGEAETGAWGHVLTDNYGRRS